MSVSRDLNNDQSTTFKTPDFELQTTESDSSLKMKRRSVRFAPLSDTEGSQTSSSTLMKQQDIDQLQHVLRMMSRNRRKRTRTILLELEAQQHQPSSSSVDSRSVIQRSTELNDTLVRDNEAKAQNDELLDQSGFKIPEVTQPDVSMRTPKTVAGY